MRKLIASLGLGLGLREVREVQEGDMFIARRRSQLVAGAVLLVAVVLLAGCGWPQSRYGPGQTGFNPFETTISPANVSGLGMRWSQQVPASPSHASLSSPTIANGVLYVSSDKLYAFDASTGSARWSSQGVGYTESSPVVDNGVVYVSATKDGVAQLHAFDARSGTARWSQNIDQAAFSPTVANGVVYVGGDKLYAFNATTGARLWSVDLGPSGFGFGSPAVANGVVYVGGDKLYAFNAATGAQLWSGAAATGYSSPAVADGVVYVGNERLYALNAATGAQLWSAATGNGYGVSPAVANGVVYVGGDKLYAYNAGLTPFGGPVAMRVLGGVGGWSSAQRTRLG